MLEIKICHKISEIGPDTWNNLLPSDYPFCRYEFLHALEESGSVSAKTGWQPLHIQLQDNGITVAILPLYLKNHSYGEYVFDWAWAEAYERYGMDYYPKLVSSVPFSPVGGPRLLTKQPIEPLFESLSQAIPQLCQHFKATSWHLLFPSKKEADSLDSENYMIRKGCQYQWFNQDYASYDDFLQNLTSRKRKNLKKERKKIDKQGITHRQIQGKDITDNEIDTFYDFYRLTYLKRGREAYLSKSFFIQLKQTMPENLFLVLAYKDETPVAGALSLQDSTTLYGRYWGCFDEYDSLHFETCYYQGIEYCISLGLKRFDSGAQGEHKIQRGFTPVPTYSAHWLKEVGFNKAVQQFIDEETSAIDEQIEQLKKYLPYKAL